MTRIPHHSPVPGGGNRPPGRPSDCDVAVIGAGPVGSILAGLLGRRGLKVIVLDRDPDVFPLPRAGHLDHTALRTIQEVGCLDELLPEMVANRGLDLVTRSGQVLAHLPGNQPTLSGLPASMHFHQPTFDRTLRRTAAGMPTVELRLEWEAVDLRPHEDQVTLIATHQGEKRELRAPFVVGCDGASSTTRAIAGIGLEDLGFEEKWLVIDLILHGQIPGLPRNTTEVCDPERPLVAVPMPKGRYRFEFMMLPGEGQEEIQHPDSVWRLLAPWLRADQVEIERTAVYEFHGLVAKRWRAGRIFLAGDAAHQTPPFLGQGMCAGFRDAVNLAWKLDHVIRRGAPPSLLDTYETERKPHARRVIEAAIRYGRLLCTIDRQQAAERDRRMLSDSTPPEQRIPFQLGELDPGPLVLRGGGEFFIQPEVDGRRLDDIVGQRFLVLGCTRADLGPAASWWSDQVGALVTTVEDLDDAKRTLQRWMDRRAASVVVVRPDRYVLGSGQSLEELTAPVRPLLIPERATAA